MKKDMDKIIIESREEIDLLQNICERFYALSKSSSENKERELAKKMSAILDDMYMSW